MTEIQENTAELRVVSGPLVGPILSRVLGMLAARAQCPIDRLDDALLVADAVAAHGPRYAREGITALQVHAREGLLELAVEELEPQGGRQLLHDSELPGVGNVLERVADEVAIEQTDGGERLRVRFTFAA